MDWGSAIGAIIAGAIIAHAAAGFVLVCAFLWYFAPVVWQIIEIQYLT